MPDVNRETLWDDMDRLAQRMGTRLSDLRNHSEQAQQRGRLTRLAERHRHLRQRFEAAQGSDWDTAKQELAREHGDLYEEFVKFEEKLDHDEQHRPGRVPGAKSGLV